jgi:hypothetical protein
MSARLFLAGVAVLAVSVGCAAQVPSTRAPEALYLAVEVSQHGHTVARPKVVGYEGRNITVERRQPDAPNADYRLILMPKEEGQGYGVKLDLELPSGRRLGHIGLLHGEERRVLLDSDIELKVMLMRVDSPEFKALIQRSPKLAKNAI